MFLDINPSIRMFSVNVSLELLERDLIAVLKFPVVLGVLLNCVVCEVYVFTVKVIKTEFLARSSYIPTILKEEGFELTID